MPSNFAPRILHPGWFLQTLLCLQILAVLAHNIPSSPGFFNPPVPTYGSGLGGASIFAEGKIIVLRNNNTCPDRQAAFGPQVPEEGIFGVVLPLSNWSHLGRAKGDERVQGPTLVAFTGRHEQNSGCVEVPGVTLPNWIAIVQRGDCSFVQKVRAMQSSGAKAVVVGDNVPHSPLITMFASENVSDITIPSVFITFTDYHSLLEEADIGGQRGVEIVILPGQTDVPLLEILVVTVLSPAAVMIALYLIWSYRQYVRRQQELAPLAVVLNLPVKIYSTEVSKENDPTDCAICLDDFQDGDELRILLCKHEYHKECIDKWLTQRKRTCPICKHDTCPTTDSADETTPLLPGSADNV
ncbi:uncharacterized protein EV422DRAFT_562783 [Fimicolochytrium jonesii]|uniref:uncharacterized protein n=1 Tax=Fimicolochytrium jonesii TaxID=1396493 RepID=UPI0022FF07EA|nr:uncharacterized protein EV422DRAFT_562783 [Fimicolochytrium jonesii]KAI8826729.1 hypothetical protein EV422DRAFT_562783 [Fimicolochytrium jonesii]